MFGDGTLGRDRGDRNEVLTSDVSQHLRKRNGTGTIREAPSESRVVAYVDPNTCDS